MMSYQANNLYGYQRNTSMGYGQSQQGSLPGMGGVSGGVYGGSPIVSFPSANVVQAPQASKPYYRCWDNTQKKWFYWEKDSTATTWTEPPAHITLIDHETGSVVQRHFESVPPPPISGLPNAASLSQQRQQPAVVSTAAAAASHSSVSPAVIANDPAIVAAYPAATTSTRINYQATGNTVVTNVKQPSSSGDLFGSTNSAATAFSGVGSVNALLNNSNANAVVTTNHHQNTTSASVQSSTASSNPAAAVHHTGGVVSNAPQSSRVINPSYSAGVSRYTTTMPQGMSGVGSSSGAVTTNAMDAAQAAEKARIEEADRAIAEALQKEWSKEADAEWLASCPLPGEAAKMFNHKKATAASVAKSSSVATAAEETRLISDMEKSGFVVKKQKQKKPIVASAAQQS